MKFLRILTGLSSKNSKNTIILKKFHPFFLIMILDRTTFQNEQKRFSSVFGYVQSKRKY